MRKLLLSIVCVFISGCFTDSNVKKTSIYFQQASINLNKPVQKPSLVEQIKRDGILVVVTRVSPTTYYLDSNDKPAGFELDLTNRFAKSLGVDLVVITASRFESMIPMLADNRAHMAAAGITASELDHFNVRFSKPYQHVNQAVVYRKGQRRPRNLDDIRKGLMEVTADSRHEKYLHQSLSKNPSLKWLSNYLDDTNGLLSLVWNKKIDYTMVHSHELALSQRFYPELRMAFTVSESNPIAWAFSQDSDESLYLVANRFLDDLANNGELDDLLKRYYGSTEKLSYYSAIRFIKHLDSRLPRYKKWFKKYAKRQNLDWRLLAAIGYQESLWNPKAVSPTGVRGIMMLTRRTARSLKVKNRLDPIQSIDGGARFYRKMYQTLPISIQQPDRTWMALAAYNVGYGHLMDARSITKKLGGNVDKWADVSRHLPLLSKKKWYSQTRYGQARGNEPVIYVNNIRRYLATLTWYSDHKHELQGRSFDLAQIVQ